MDGTEIDVDPNVSLSDTSAFLNEAVCSTPDTELSIADITASKQRDQTARVWATGKVAELTQQEKVISHTQVEDETY